MLIRFSAARPLFDSYYYVTPLCYAIQRTLAADAILMLIFFDSATLIYYDSAMIRHASPHPRRPYHAVIFDAVVFAIAAFTRCHFSASLADFAPADSSLFATPCRACREMPPHDARYAARYFFFMRAIIFIAYYALFFFAIYFHIIVTPFRRYVDAIITICRYTPLY